MMKNKNIVSLLSIGQITHIGFMFILLLLTTNILYLSLDKREELNDLKNNFGKINSKISEEFGLIEDLSGTLIAHIKTSGIQTLNLEMSNFLFPPSPLISSIAILNDSSNVLISIYTIDSITQLPPNKPKDRINSHWSSFTINSIARTFYSNKIDEHNSLYILLHENWLLTTVKRLKIENECSVIIFDTTGQLINQSILSGSFPDNKTLLDSEGLFHSKSPSYENNYNCKKIKSGKEWFNSFSLKNEKLNLYITVFQTTYGYFRTSNQFLKISVVSSILIFLLTVLLLRLTNYKLTHPIVDLISSIKSSNYLRDDISNKDNEAEIIRKYIGVLENQIVFNEKKNENILSSNLIFENDLKIAKKLQRNLLPSITQIDTNHKEFELYAYSEPAFDIGGDLFDYFLIDDEHLFVAVADVAGKGIPASLYMIYTHTLMRSISKPGSSVSDIIETLNNKLINENISDMFVTIFLGILNTTTGEFIYCNSAHNYPCMITSTGNVIELSETHGIPIGIYPNRKYLSSSIFLKDGDQVFIYTDGLTDTVDESGLKYTVDVLKYNLMGTWFFSAKELVEKIRNSIVNFRGKNLPVDDLTIVNLKFTPGRKDDYQADV